MSGIKLLKEDVNRCSFKVSDMKSITLRSLYATKTDFPASKVKIIQGLHSYRPCKLIKTSRSIALLHIDFK